MDERLIERIDHLLGIVEACEYGSVTLVIEKGRVARIVWSVSEQLRD